MSDPTVAPQASRPRGRRARRLAEDPQPGGAAPQGPSVPRVRGAVASPTADAPKPALRRYGRRARIIELVELPDVAGPAAAPGADRASGSAADSAATPTAETSTAAGEGARPAPSAPSDAAASAGAPSEADVSAEAPPEAAPVTVFPSAAAPSAGGAAAAPTAGGAAAAPTSAQTVGATGGSSAASTTIVRDNDGVELGEAVKDEAPDPRPAPRFEGRVLNRREQGRGRALLWLVWILVALAIIALVVLLATGIIGGNALAVPGLSAVLLPRIIPVRPERPDTPYPHQEETAA